MVPIVTGDASDEGLRAVVGVLPITTCPFDDPDEVDESEGEPARFDTALILRPSDRS
jgi:hypothetical protein